MLGRLVSILAGLLWSPLLWMFTALVSTAQSLVLCWCGFTKSI